MSSPPAGTRFRYGSQDRLPPYSIRSFSHVNRFWDPIRQMVTAKILPGEYYATTADELVATVLGSCVSVCIWDLEAGIGGMNHFMIPTTSRLEADNVTTLEAPARYGMFAMELLVNSILRHGGSRPRLEAKITGGGRVVPIVTGIGERNIEFARQYLADEGIHVQGEHVGGHYARKVIFHPLSGRAEVLAIKEARNNTVAQREHDYVTRIRPFHPGDVELFEE